MTRKIVLATIIGMALMMGTAHAEHVQFGLASWYNMKGHKTASGERMNPWRLTAAHRTLPLGSKAVVTNRENGRSVLVTITDRGPKKRKRIIDLSPAAAKQLDMKDDGVAPVVVRRLVTGD